MIHDPYPSPIHSLSNFSTLTIRPCSSSRYSESKVRSSELPPAGSALSLVFLPLSPPFDVVLTSVPNPPPRGHVNAQKTHSQICMAHRRGTCIRSKNGGGERGRNDFSRVTKWGGGPLKEADQLKAFQNWTSGMGFVHETSMWEGCFFSLAFRHALARTSK
jgi:hypothetical protein